MSDKFTRGMIVGLKMALKFSEEMPAERWETGELDRLLQMAIDCLDSLLDSGA